MAGLVDHRLAGFEVDTVHVIATVQSQSHKGTKFRLIGGSSENDIVDLLAQIFAENEVQVSTLSWIARVSSHSNIVDAPSRGDTCKLLKDGLIDVVAETLISLAAVSAILKCKLGEMAGSTRQPNVKKKSPTSAV